MRSLNKAAAAAICLLGGMALAQAAEKPTDPQIAHIAYTAGVLDITAARPPSPSPSTTSPGLASPFRDDGHPLTRRRRRQMAPPFLMPASVAGPSAV